MTEFWDWAVATYARPGVAEASLRLQDEHGQCVPLLLWAAWAGEPGLAMEAALLARAWLPVIEPLRGVRRRLKVEVSAGDETDRLALRNDVKGVELRAEKALMARLAILIPGPDALENRRPAVLAAVEAWGETCPVAAIDDWLSML